MMKTHSNQSTYIMRILCAAIAAVVMIVFAMFLVDAPKTTIGGEVWLRSAQVISPKPPAVRTYEAGSRQEFRIMFAFHYCANTMPSSLGAITRPVPYGQPHTAFGPERASALTTGVATGNANAQYRYYFSSTYNQYFNVPTVPGTYWFKYRVGSRNAQNTDQFFGGTVVFKVDPVDVCTNINGLQVSAGSGKYETVDQSGRRVCYDEGDQSLRCTVSKSPVFVSESVTFNSQTVDGNTATINWYEGAAVEGNKVKTNNNVTQSSYQTTYTEPGNYYVTSQALDSNGNINECRIGVTVYPDPASDLASDGDGQLYFTDPNAPPGEIDFGYVDADGPGGLTNSGSCTLSWNITNMLGCQLYKNGEVFETINFVDEMEVDTGAYQIKCLQLRDASEVVSDVLQCRQNPNIREV